MTQILGATTNSTFGSQTFGITSGTSGCTEDGAVKLARETEVFTEINFAALRRDIAAGEGEYVATLATLLGVSQTHQSALIGYLQTEYSALFPSTQTTSEQMLDTLARKLAQRPELLG